jgi:hypothetical protein
MNFTEFRIARTIGVGNLVVRIALYTSITSLTLSIALLLLFGKTTGIYSGWHHTLVWYAMFASLWILMISPVYLLVATIYGQVSENKGLQPLTKEFILLLVNIFIAGMYVVTAFQINTP